MSSKKAKELPNIMSLPSKAPEKRKDEIPHWKAWRFSLQTRKKWWKDGS